MAGFIAWLGRNAEAVIALLTAAVVIIAGLVSDPSPELVGGATLAVLALLTTSVLRDRWTGEPVELEMRSALADTRGAVKDLPEQLERIAALDQVVSAAQRTLEDASMMRVLRGPEVGHAHEEARRETDRWIFKGGTGTYLRAVTLPECAENARRASRALLMQLEIIDPTSEAVCERYAAYRKSLARGPDGTGELWTTDRARREAYATILAARWYQGRYQLLDIDVGLSSTMTTLRWDLSSVSVIITQEDPTAPALCIDRGRFFYDCVSTELMTSFRQAARVPLDRTENVPLSEEPTVLEVRRFFAELDMELPRTFNDRDVADIVRRALKPRNPFP